MAGRPPWHARLIGAACAAYSGCVYVEVGVGEGMCVRVVAVDCAEVHGVDKEHRAEVMPPGSTFWHMDSNRFFAVEYDGAAPHVVFIDGDHSDEQVSADFAGAERIVRAGGMIFLHDSRRGDDGEAYRLRQRLEADGRKMVTWNGRPGLTAVEV